MPKRITPPMAARIQTTGLVFRRTGIVLAAAPGIAPDGSVTAAEAPHWEQKAPATVVPQDEQNGIGVPPLPLTLRHRVAGVQRARILKLVRLTDCNLSFTIRYDLRLL